MFAGLVLDVGVDAATSSSYTGGCVAPGGPLILRLSDMAKGPSRLPHRSKLSTTSSHPIQ